MADRLTLTPAQLEAIDAEFVAAVYDAERRASLRRAGVLPPAPADRRALRLLHRIEAKSRGLAVVR